MAETQQTATTAKNPYAPNPDRSKFKAIIAEMRRKKEDPNFIRYVMDQEGYDVSLVDAELANLQRYESGEPFPVASYSEKIDLTPAKQQEFFEENKNRETLIKNATEYKKLVDEYGFESSVFSPEIAGKMSGLRAGLLADIKKAETLGTLDKGLLDFADMLLGVDPTGLTGNITNIGGARSKEISSKIDQLIASSQTKIDANKRMLGINEPQGAQDLSPQQPMGVNATKVDNEMSQANEWLKQNPDDPRAELVRQKLASIGFVEGEQPITQEQPQTSATGQFQASQDTQQEESKGWFDEIMSSAERRAGEVGSILNSSSSKGNKGIQIFGQGAGLGADIIGTVLMKSLSAVTPDSIETPVKEALGSAMANIISSEPAQKVSKNWEKFKKENPDTAGAIEAGGNVAMLGTSFFGGGQGWKVALKAGEAGAKMAGMAGKAAKATGAGVENVGAFAASQLTGIPRQGIQTIANSPEKFTKEAMAQTNRLSLAGKVKDAIDGRLSELSNTGAEYTAIRQGTDSVVVPKKGISDALEKYGITMQNGKVVTSAETVPLGAGDISAIENFFAQYGDAKLSANGFLNARQALSQMSDYDATKTGYAEKIARDLRSVYDEHGKIQIKGLAELDAKYASEIKELKKIKQDYLTADGSLKDGALSKIASLGGKGKDLVLERLEKVVPTIREDVNILNVVESLDNADFKVGAYAKSGLVGGVASGGNPVAAFGAMLLANPSISVPIIRAYGAVKGIVTEGIIEKMKSGAKLAKDELKLIDKALQTASGKLQNKLIDKVKGIRPGMNIQDVNTMTPEQLKKAGLGKTNPVVGETALVQEARKYKSAEEFVKAHDPRLDLKIYSKINMDGTPYKINDIFTNAAGNKSVVLANERTGREMTMPLKDIPVESIQKKTFLSSDMFFGKNAKIKLRVNEPNYQPSIDYAKEQIKNGARPSVKISDNQYGKGFTVSDGNHTLEAYRQLGVKEIPIIDYTEGKKASQLTDIWNKANKGDLLEEARKFKTAEEFVKAMDNMFEGDKANIGLYPETKKIIDSSGISSSLEKLRNIYKLSDVKIKKPKFIQTKERMYGHDVDVGVSRQKLSDGIDLVIRKGNSVDINGKIIPSEKYDSWLEIGGFRSTIGKGSTIDDVLPPLQTWREYRGVAPKLFDTESGLSGADILDIIKSKDLSNKLADSIKKDIDSLPIKVDDGLGLSASDKKIAEKLARAWDANNLASHGYMAERGFFTKQAYANKERLIKEAISDIKNTKSTINYGEKDGVIYFDIGNRQISFHKKNDFGFELPEYTKEWIGKRTNENPLEMTNSRYNEMLSYGKDEPFGVKRGKTKSQLIDIWNKANKSKK